MATSSVCRPTDCSRMIFASTERRAGALDRSMSERGMGVGCIKLQACCIKMQVLSTGTDIVNRHLLPVNRHWRRTGTDGANRAVPAMGRGRWRAALDNSGLRSHTGGYGRPRDLMIPFSILDL